MIAQSRSPKCCCISATHKCERPHTCARAWRVESTRAGLRSRPEMAHTISTYHHHSCGKKAVRKLVQKGNRHSGTACKAGPGNHEHRFSRVFTGLCSWIPGSRAVPAPRKDIVFEFPDNRFRGNDDN